MFLTKSSYWLSIWQWTSETKENKHRNITRFIYLAHFISNLYSISVFKDSRKVWEFTVTQLYWRRDAIHWEKKYWQECENTGKRSKNRFHITENNAVQFDDLKSELIHFESHKMTLNQMIILLNNMIIKSKTCVRWLKVWLNRKLNFKVHVQTKIATVTRTLHSLFRLMNSEWN